MSAKSKVESRKSKVLRHVVAATAGLVLASSLVPHPSSLARAAHPFVTDDAGTQGAGNWQLELMGQRDRHDAAGDAGAGPVIQRSRSTLLNPVLTYGLREDLDLAVGVSRERFRTTENGLVTENESGMADSTLELKWRFFERDGLSFALKPGVTLPTGDERRGLGTGRASWSVNLIGAYEADPWAVFANLAYARQRYELAADAAASRDNLWRLSAGATLAVRKDLRLAGEAGVRTNEARDDPFFPGRRAAFAMAGLIYSPAENIDLDIGVRKALNRAETDIVFLIGATFRW